jgi:uncharacterized Fe-S cluster-containing radical SAM superfamily protein
MVDPEQIERGEDGFPLEDVDSLADSPSPDAADDCDLAEERKGMENNSALYRRFRDDPAHYAGYDPPGSVSGDLVGCGFACRQCWSTYGLAGKDKAKWYTAQQAAERLIGLCQKHNRRIVRFSNGEPFLHFEHMLEASELILQHEVPFPPIQLRIETNGLHATPDRMVQFNEMARRYYTTPRKGSAEVTMGENARVTIWWSVKSFDSEWWSWHTGRPESDWDIMMDNLEWSLQNADAMFLDIAVVSEIITGEELHAFARYVDRLRPGQSNHIYEESIRVYHAKQREIDIRMGERRIRAAKASGFYGESEMWTDKYLMNNRLVPDPAE